MLERRVRRLERLVYERSIGHAGMPSIAMNIWAFLMGHGPATKEEIDAELGARYSNNPALNSWIRAGLITKRGDKYVANSRYSWDDVGVIDNDGASQDDVQDDPSSDEIADNSTGRRSRTPRQPRQRTVRPNLFSKKLEEVKAAIEAGTNVDTTDDRGKTAISKAIVSKSDMTDIINYLLDQNASLSVKDIENAFKHRKVEALKTIFNKGLYNSYVASYFGRTSPISRALENGINDLDLNKAIINSLVNENTPSWLIRDLAGTLISNLQISDSDYDILMNMLIDRLNINASNIDEYFDRYLPFELHRGGHLLLDKYIELGLFPQIRSIQYDLFKNKRESVERVYNALRDNISRLNIRNPLNFYKTAQFICDTLNKPTDWLADKFDAKFFSELDQSQVEKFISNFAMNNNADGLSKLTKLDVIDNPETVHKITVCIDDFRLTDATKKVLFKMLNRCKDSRFKAIMDDLACVDDRSLINYLIDRGFGEDLAKQAPAENGVVSRMLRDAGYEVASSDPFSPEGSNNRMVRAFISDIANDNPRRVEDRLRNNPDLLQNKEVIDTVYDDANDHNVTARMLRRRINKSADVYDL